MTDEILPRTVNPTEERQIQLLFNLLKNRNGISLESLQNRLMPQAYTNENRDSDRRKFKRDIDELKQLGFAIKRYADDLDENKSIYKVVTTEESKIKFTSDELKQLSLSILKHYNKNSSDELFTAAGKIFASNLNLFPPIRLNKVLKNSTGHESQIEKLIQCLRDRIPVRIEYNKSSREIEPLRMIKRNHEDFYLIAWDRKAKIVKRFLIPKIGQITELDGDYLFRGTASADDLNLHPLNVRIHESETYRFKCNPGLEWKMKNFLSGHNYTAADNIYSVTTTNKQALFDFLTRENEVVAGAGANLLRELESYQGELIQLYESKNI